MKCINSCIFRFWFERQDVKMLIKHQKPPPQYETPPPPAPPPTSQSDTAETDSTSSSESVSCSHVWKEKEEDTLVHLRHERQDLKKTKKNKKSLHIMAGNFRRALQDI